MPVSVHQLPALDAGASLKSATTGLSNAEVEGHVHEFSRQRCFEIWHALVNSRSR
jgi:predicted DNA-binding helix-hairpin-helix protein